MKNLLITALCTFATADEIKKQRTRSSLPSFGQILNVAKEMIIEDLKDYVAPKPEIAI